MKTKGTIHLTDEQTALYAEHLTSGTTNELAHKIRAHVKNCTLCSQRVLMVAHTIDDINNHTDKPIILSSWDKKAKKIHWFSIAASIALIISAYYFINIFFNSVSPKPVAWNEVIESIETPDHITQIDLESNKQISAITSNDTARQLEKTTHKKAQITKYSPQIRQAPETLQIAYTTNPELEKLCQRYQSGSLRGDEIEILSPTHINGKKGEVHLQWNNEANQLLTLEFLNNKGEKLFETETNASDYTPVKLQKSGLYYWKLMNEDFDLLFCGKITLK
jgi:hypothetical protein